MIRVEVVLAWPERVESRLLELGEGATVAEAVVAAGIEGSEGCPAVAVHGVLARGTQLLLDGDRVELLRPLVADPKDNRRRRARER
ncbi:RnfH family protein [uncultured Stenotrophomonas sp.]|uniref:RnfH family protein n=1 Tax=uncultured Stenotrophomonas sp. TaxID=165438 RepID=UPI0028ED58D0|nr:RnfH family protein [uncultured Stenotrophomonas sp.]